jgi:hypothetical protein
MPFTGFEAVSSHRLLRDSDTYLHFRDGLYLVSKDAGGDFLLMN